MISFYLQKYWASYSKDTLTFVMSLFNDSPKFQTEKVYINYKHNYRATANFSHVIYRLLVKATRKRLFRLEIPPGVFISAAIKQGSVRQLPAIS